MVNVFGRAKYAELTHSSKTKTKRSIFSSSIDLTQENAVLFGRVLSYAGTPKDVVIKGRLIYKDNSVLQGTNKQYGIEDENQETLITVAAGSLSSGQSIDFSVDLTQIGTWKFCEGIELQFSHSGTASEVQTRIEAYIFAGK